MAIDLNRRKATTHLKSLIEILNLRFVLQSVLGELGASQVREPVRCWIFFIQDFLLAIIAQYVLVLRTIWWIITMLRDDLGWLILVPIVWGWWQVWGFDIRVACLIYELQVLSLNVAETTHGSEILDYGCLTALAFLTHLWTVVPPTVVEGTHCSRLELLLIWCVHVCCWVWWAEPIWEGSTTKAQRLISILTDTWRSTRISLTRWQVEPRPIGFLWDLSESHELVVIDADGVILRNLESATSEGRMHQVMLVIGTS